MYALWCGRLPLSTAFWTWALLWGTLFNLAATAGKFGLIAARQPGEAALAVAFLPVPYTIIASVGVMRSASRYEGRRFHAAAAEVAIVAWACLMMVV